MGKHTDKAYITHSEWLTDFGGAKTRQITSQFKRLPFHCCSLSLQPFENPVCTSTGTIYELLYILPWLKQYKTDPVTGQPLDAKDLITLNFHKNHQGEFHCPVTFKVFNEHSHIVAIKSTGNVYSWDAIQQLIIEPKNFRDLITDQKITKKEFITLQDPSHLEARNINEFYYFKNDLKVDNPQLSKLQSQIDYKINASLTASKVFSEMAQSSTFQAKTNERKTEEIEGKTAYAKGITGSSLTSTATEIVTANETEKVTELDQMLSNVKGKGYATFKTNLGDLNVELYCQETPKTCYNFIALAKKGYYKDTKFHRSIRNFMIQGGDPTFTGSGGESIYGHPFEDEIVKKLKHDDRGILSMANSGPNSNTSQFFFTFRACSHLDRKHTVFGKVVGGKDVLTLLERTPTTKKDRPLDDIHLKDVIIYKDPFEEFQAKSKEKQEKEQEKLEKLKLQKEKEKLALQAKPRAIQDESVGKYLSMKRPANDEQDKNVKAQKIVKGRGFDFSNW